VKESSTYQAIYQEGWELGYQEGLQIARETRRAEESLRVLLRLGKIVTETPSFNAFEHLRTPADIEAMDYLIERIHQVLSPDETTAPPATVRKSRKKKP
jgi:hypothetical protein